MSHIHDLSAKVKNQNEEQHRDFISAFLSAYDEAKLFDLENNPFDEDDWLFAHYAKNVAFDVVADLNPQEKIRRIIYALTRERQIGYMAGKKAFISGLENLDEVGEDQ